MKVTKKYLMSFLLVSLFMVGQATGVLSFTHQASAATSLWDEQLGLGGDDQGVIGKTGFSKNSSNTDDIRTVIGRIIQIILTFLGTIFIVLMLIAGFKWMNSQGDENTINEAKGTIKAAVIGLAIVMSSYAVTVMVMNYIYQATP